MTVLGLFMKPSTFNLFFSIYFSGFPPTIVVADVLIGPMAGLFGEQALHSIENVKKSIPQFIGQIQL